MGKKGKVFPETPFEEFIQLQKRDSFTYTAMDLKEIMEKSREIDELVKQRNNDAIARAYYFFYRLFEPKTDYQISKERGESQHYEIKKSQKQYPF